MERISGKRWPQWASLTAVLVAALLLVLLCILRGPRPSPPGVPTQWSEPVNGLSFQLEAPAKIKAGAELKLALTIRNDGPRKIKFYTAGTWLVNLSPQEKGRPALSSSDSPWLEQEGMHYGAEVLDLAPGAEEKRTLRCSGWCSGPPLPGLGMRPLPGRYCVSVAHYASDGGDSREQGYWLGTTESRRAEIEVEDSRAAEGRPANGLTAAFSVSPAVLEIPTDPAKPPVCPFTLSLDISSTGTGEGGGRVRLVPFGPDGLEIADDRGRPVVYYADQNWARDGVFPEPKETDFPEISTLPGARKANFKVEGLIGCDGTIFVRSPGYLTWRTIASLPPGTYRLRAVYENYMSDRGGSRYQVSGCWVGMVVSNAVTIKIGRPPAGLITADRATEIGFKELCSRNPGWNPKPGPDNKPALIDGYIWRISAAQSFGTAISIARVDVDARTGKVSNYEYIPGE